MHLIVFLFYSLLSLLCLHNLLPVWSQAIPGGLEDTRLFLWNAWWFRHAIHTLHASPFFTHLLFHPFGTSLVSHDFPLWTNAVTFAGQAAGLNFVAASNVWFILTWILAGFCSYLLVWEVVQQRGPAIVAGVYVMTHSYTLARAMQNWGQFNLFGIALFLWTLARARRLGRMQDFVLSGAALAWTAACHYYFLIYSGAIWLTVAVADVMPWRVQLDKRKNKNGYLVLAALAGAVAAWIIFLHPGSLMLGKVRIGLETPANALLVMWVGVMGWVASGWRLNPHPQPLSLNRERVKDGMVLVTTALLCLSPLLMAAIKLALSGDYPKQSILWKTHLPGANLFALFTPNPVHAWWGPTVSQWFLNRGMNPQEEAASIGWVCMGIVLWSGVGGKIRHWLGLAIAATVLSMGTYLHLAQWNLWMPLPFYVWRLLPVLGNVRVPERWMAVGAIAWSVVLALAIQELAKKKGWRLNKVCLVAGALIFLENWPGIPLGTPPADQPVYETLRLQPPGGVLPLPLYIGDSSIGAGDAPGTLAWDTLAAQIYHQHPILGGYVGRISRRIIQQYKADPYFAELISLEEGGPTTGRSIGRKDACKAMKNFDVTYVLLYTHTMNPAAFNFVTQTLPVQLITQDPHAELYRVNCR